MKKKLPDILTKGCEKIIYNAQKLFISAVDIKKSNPPLAYFIFQISMEEAAKIEIIGRELTSFYNLKNEKIDINKIRKKIFSHEEKNFENAYFQTQQDYEIDALKSKDPKKIIESHIKLKTEYHKEKNYLKNASLYTNFNKLVFTLPEEIIKSNKVDDIEKEAYIHISMMLTKVKLLNLWRKDPPRKMTAKEMLEEIPKMLGIIKSMERKRKKINRKNLYKNQSSKNA